MNKYKILFIDMDDTLIRTRSGRKLSKGIWDMEIRMDTLNAIRKLAPSYVLIVTNQGGIEKKIVREDSIIAKMSYLATCIRDYCKSVKAASFAYCKTMNPEDPFRKPNAGSLEKGLLSINEVYEGAEKSDCLMVGDASGLPGNWSDNDKKCAENFGCDYLDIDEFLRIYGASK